MTRDEAIVGTRVTWADDELTGIEIGVIMQPSAEDLDYAAETYGSSVGPAAGHVLVQWNGEDWNSAWHPLEHLQLVACVAKP